MPHLFEPLTLGELTLANRIVIAPMCQYSAEDGRRGIGTSSTSAGSRSPAPGLLDLEATAVSPEGRITAGDLGLYDDATEAALGRVHRSRAENFADRDRHPDRPRRPQGVEPGSLERRRAEALRRARRLARPSPPPPCPTRRAKKRRRRSTGRDWRKCARISSPPPAAPTRLGLEAIELHGAHGYLLHEFCRPFPMCAHRRIWRIAGEPHALSPRSVRGGAGGGRSARTPVGMRFRPPTGSKAAGTSSRRSHGAQSWRRAAAAATHVSSGGVSPKKAIKSGRAIRFRSRGR